MDTVEKDCQPGSPFLFGIENPATSKAPHPAPHRKGGAHDEAPANPDPPMPLLPKTVSPVRAVHLSTTLGPAPMLSSLSTPRINHISNHFAKFTPTKNNSFPDCTPEPAPNLPELPHPISRTHHEPLNPEKELQKNSSNPRPAPTVSAQQPQMLSSLSTTRMNNIPNYLAKIHPNKKQQTFPNFTRTDRRFRSASALQGSSTSSP
jgi:hypothetical protein